MNIDYARLTTNADRIIETVDLHTAGEPLRLVLSGWPEIEGKTILERRRFVKENHDDLRRAIMLEPRGHRNMYGCLLMPPATDDGDFGVLFLHNEGLSTMCGHGIIAVATGLYHAGMLTDAQIENGIRFDTPAGRVIGTPIIREDQSKVEVRMRNVPSFLYAENVSVKLASLGSIKVDIAFGGAFYAILPVSLLEETFDSPLEKLVELCDQIKQQLQQTSKPVHPFEEDLGFLYGVILTGSPEDPNNHSRNLCVFADREVDRSPTGTGVSARAAQLVAQDKLHLDETIRIESILGANSAFAVRAVESTQFGSYAAVIPEVTGSAFVYGLNRLIINQTDPLNNGFYLTS